MSTVKITYGGPVALVMADEDHTEEDWDEAARELGLRGFAPVCAEAHRVLADGSELYVWCRQYGLEPASGLDIVTSTAVIEVKRQPL